MGKQNAKRVKKYSIKEVDSLIKSIQMVDASYTEERISAELMGYNKGYITQMRSREENGAGPQVSPKFLDSMKEKIATLQNAIKPDSSLAAIANALIRIENGQTLIRAEIRGYGQYQIQEKVKWDQREFLKAMEKVGNLIGANLQVGD